MADEPELDEFTLAIGATRPPLMPYLNVPWRDFIIFLMVGFECLLFRWQLLLFVVIPFVGSLVLYRKDYNAGRVFLCWLQTSGRHLGAAVFGGTFLSPAPHAATRGLFRGIAPNVE